MFCVRSVVTNFYSYAAVYKQWKCINNFTLAVSNTRNATSTLWVPHWNILSIMYDLIKIFYLLVNAWSWTPSYFDTFYLICTKSVNSLPNTQTDKVSPIHVFLSSSLFFFKLSATGFEQHMMTIADIAMIHTQCIIKIHQRSSEAHIK